MLAKFKTLPVEWLQAGKYQPRQSFDPHLLQELAHSIVTQGLIEPLVVREITTNRYEIIAGERRWRAAQLAGLTELPCMIGDYSDQQAAAVTLIENIQRQDLNLLEEADGYQRLLHEFNFQQDEIATLVGKSRSHVANILRLLSLSSPVQEMLRNRELSLGHARMLVSLSSPLQAALARKTLELGWSVRRLEEEVRTCKSASEQHPNSESRDQDIAHLQTQLAEQIGAPVEILTDTQGGWLKIKFFDNDTLAGLLERMGLRYD